VRFSRHSPSGGQVQLRIKPNTYEWQAQSDVVPCDSLLLFFEQIREKASKNPQVIQTALANPPQDH